MALKPDKRMVNRIVAMMLILVLAMSVVSSYRLVNIMVINGIYQNRPNPGAVGAQRIGKDLIAYQSALFR